QFVVVVLPASENSSARSAEHVRGQVLRRRLARAARDAHDRLAPRLDHSASHTLQRVNHVFDEEQTVSVVAQLLVALDALGARDRCDRALLERLRYEAVRVCERRGREAVASVVFGREGKEKLARRGRARVNRKAIYFFVKEPLARPRRGARPVCRVPYSHSVSPRRTVSAGARAPLPRRAGPPLSLPLN